jgi:hypothetical protein
MNLLVPIKCMMEYIDNQMPDFPVIDIDFDWDNLKEGLIPVYTTKYIYTCSKDIFEKYYLNHYVVDSRFEIFKIVQRREVSFIRKYFFCKYELIFKKQDSVYSLLQIKDYILKSVTDLNAKERTAINDEIIEEIRCANSFDEICCGEKLNYKFY